MNTDRAPIGVRTVRTPGMDEILVQYGCGPVQFTGRADALYERHLMFDNILDPAAVGYWTPVAKCYGLNITVVNPAVDATFHFMNLDHDGKIRTDCSSPYAMAGSVKLKDRLDVAFGNDPDADRHGIVTGSMGLMNPNHDLVVAIRYLLAQRPPGRPRRLLVRPS